LRTASIARISTNGQYPAKPRWSAANRPRPTLAQIARELGVSVMSVSNAYTRPDQLSDALRERILARAHELGLRLPEDLSVVGFDDSPAATRADLTTVSQPSVDKGRRAGELLLSLLAGSGGDGHAELLPTELIVRGSTGPPPR